MKKYRLVLISSFILVFFILFPSCMGYFHFDSDLFLINNKSSILNSCDLIIYNPYEDINFQSTNFYKTNLHTHTTESDGLSNPDEVIYHYHYFGNYDILSITDHNKNTWPWSDWISEKPLEKSSSSEYYPDLNMLAISGNELSMGHHRGNFLNDFSYGGFFLRLSFWYIKRLDGMTIFNHPGRYNYPVSWYQKFFDDYENVIFGIEVYNQGDRYPEDRLLWDGINRVREPNNLIWGFSNDDMHDISKHSFRNYQYLLMNDLTEEEFRNSLSKGSFYFCYEPNGSVIASPNYGKSKTPKLIDVIINEKIIELKCENVTSIEWYNEDSQIVCESFLFNVSNIDSNFVRAVLINENGRSYIQPFGLKNIMI